LRVAAPLVAGMQAAEPAQWSRLSSCCGHAGMHAAEFLMLLACACRVGLCRIDTRSVNSNSLCPPSQVFTHPDLDGTSGSLPLEDAGFPFSEVQAKISSHTIHELDSPQRHFPTSTNSQRRHLQCGMATLPFLGDDHTTKRGSPYTLDAPWTEGSPTLHTQRILQRCLATLPSLGDDHTTKRGSPYTLDAPRTLGGSTTAHTRRMLALPLIGDDHTTKWGHPYTLDAPLIFRRTNTLSCHLDGLVSNLTVDREGCVFLLLSFLLFLAQLTFLSLQLMLLTQQPHGDRSHPVKWNRIPALAALFEFVTRFCGLGFACSWRSWGKGGFYSAFSCVV
jgi:hypothetical protein